MNVKRNIDLLLIASSADASLFLDSVEEDERFLPFMRNLIVTVLADHRAQLPRFQMWLLKVVTQNDFYDDVHDILWPIEQLDFRNIYPDTILPSAWWDTVFRIRPDLRETMQAELLEHAYRRHKARPLPPGVKEATDTAYLKERAAQMWGCWSTHEDLSGALVPLKLVDADSALVYRCYASEPSLTFEEVLTSPATVPSGMKAAPGWRKKAAERLLPQGQSWLAQHHPQLTHSGLPFDWMWGLIAPESTIQDDLCQSQS